MKKQKRLVMMLTCLLTCVLIITLAIGTTLAYYNNADSLTNKLVTTDSSVYLDEQFAPADDWLPGETKTKEVVFGNHGTSNQVIRFRVERAWLDESNNTWNPVISNPVTINWRANWLNDWDDSFISDGGWYYYNKVLAINDETDPVMESVTFSPDLANDNHIADAAHKTYRIRVYMEAADVNSDITGAEWGKKFTNNNGNVTWSAS